MEVCKQLDFNLAGGVLLHPDPQEGTHVVQEAHGTWEQSRGS